jgi:hypothetical protein
MWHEPLPSWATQRITYNLYKSRFTCLFRRTLAEILFPYFNSPVLTHSPKPETTQQFQEL